MQINRHILYWMLCLLPMAIMAQEPTPAQVSTEAPTQEAGTTPEELHKEIGARMMAYVDELNELAIVGNMQISFSGTMPLTNSYVKAIKDKVSMLDERYKSINIRWTTFTQAMQMDIADDEDLMTTMTNVEQLKQSIADSIASKKLQCNALQDFADAEVMLNGQDTVYKKLYQQAFELSLIQKTTPQLEKLKAREQALFAQLQGNYQKAQAASQVVPFLQKRMPVLDNTFANIQMVSTKIQETAYKPFIQRIKDYLIGLACIAVLLLFFSMISAKLKQAKAARQQAKQYQEMMRRNGNGTGGYPTI